MNATNGKYAFDRPVIILAAPRSGSTLLFETLMRSADFWTIGGESHAIFESIDRFNPTRGMCDSNALFVEDATPDIIAEIRRRFFRQLRNAFGRSVLNQTHADDFRPRLLEKTPKNALRVSFLNEVFPDALYVYLYRNPRENISSMMDAWQSGRFVTYPKLSGRGRPWSLLLPPGWQAYHDAPLEQIAAFQWRAANTAIVDELSKLGPSRWMTVTYRQLARDPVNTAIRTCEFSGASPDGILNFLSGGRLPFSQYTLTPPAADKWHKNARALSRVMPILQGTVDRIRESTEGIPEDEFDLAVDPMLTRHAALAQHETLSNVDSVLPVGRNQRCPCGSGKKFKHCHGNLRRQGERN